MMELAMRLLSGIALFVVLSIIAYQLFIMVRYYRVFKFSLNNYGLILPLVPFVGNVYVALFTRGKVNALSMLVWLEKHIGLPMNLWFGHKYHYVCINAEEARILLNHPKCYNKADWYIDLHHLFKNSLLTAPTEIWKLRRHYLRTAFKPSTIKHFCSTFYHQSCLLNKKIESLAPTEDLFNFFNKYVFMNFFLTASGMDNENKNPDIETFGELIDRAQDELVKIFFNPVIPLFVWLKTPFGKKLKHLKEEMENILDAIVMEKEKQCAKISEYVDGPTHVHLMDLLVSEDYKKVGESVTYELCFLAIAATDTNGHTLAFCFTLLGMYPDEQQRVYDEIVASIGDSTIDNGNIHHLKYTEVVIYETLRLFPPVPIYGRRCDEDVDLGTKVIPKGANFIVNALTIHRSPEYWEDPLKYDPTRFLPENVSKIIPGSYLPFSAGARNCIGNIMAMTLLKITVANVVRAYRITSRYKSLNDFKLESCISLKTSHHLDCTFIPRT